jgi:hypothetical protein
MDQDRNESVCSILDPPTDTHVNLFPVTWSGRLTKNSVVGASSSVYRYQISRAKRRRDTLTSICSRSLWIVLTALPVNCIFLKKEGFYFQTQKILSSIDFQSVVDTRHSNVTSIHSILPPVRQFNSVDPLKDCFFLQSPNCTWNLIWLHPFPPPSHSAVKQNASRSILVVPVVFCFILWVVYYG